MGEEISVAAKIPKGVVGKLLPYLLALLLGAGGVGAGSVLSGAPSATEAETVDHGARERIGVLEATVRAQNEAVLRELSGLRQDVQALARRPVR